MDRERDPRVVTVSLESSFIIQLDSCDGAVLYNPIISVLR